MNEPAKDQFQFYLEKSIQGNITRPMQEMLQKEWDALSPRSQAVTRSRRARQGIKCEDCGQVGYFRRNCPHCPDVKLDFKTNEWVLVIPKDQLNTIGNKGFFWRPLPVTYNDGDIGSYEDTLALHQERERQEFEMNKHPLDIDPSPAPGPWYQYRKAMEERASTKASSSPPPHRHVLPTTEDFYPGSIAEQNLHLVLERLIQVTREQLLQVIKPLQETVNRYPDKPITDKYYSEYAWDQYKDYFVKEMSVAPTEYQNHKFLQGYRKEDEFKYFADRSEERGKPSLKKYFEPKETKADSIHSTTDWLPTNSQQGRVYIPEQAHIKLEKALKNSIAKQGRWVGIQEKAMQNRRKICTHLLHVLSEELTKEERRQIEILKLRGKELKHRLAHAVEQRSEAADRIITLLEQYNIMPEIEYAEYLIYTLNVVREAGGLPKKFFTRLKSQDSASLSSGHKKKGPDIFNKKATPSKVEQTNRIYETSVQNTRDSIHRASVLRHSKSDAKLPASRHSSLARIASNNLSKNDSQTKHSSIISATEDTTNQSDFTGSVSFSIPSLQGETLDSPTSRSNSGNIVAINPTSQIEGSQLPSVHRKAQYSIKSCFAIDEHSPHPNKSSNVMIPPVEAFAVLNDPSYFRDGHSQDTTSTPAVIPVPDGYTLHDCPSDEKMPYVAEKTFLKMKQQHVHPVTGKKYEHDLVLWHRMTAEPPTKGNKRYSELFNRPYNYF